jgi:prephenate dehydratase
MEKIKVAYLGPKNTYTETAAKEMFPGAELVPLSHIKRVMLAVENDDIDYGVVPFENVYDGKRPDVIDALKDCTQESEIVRETFIPILHCFGALKGHGEITQVFSKDTALSQCDAFLSDKYPDAEPIAISSTAGGAKRIKEEGLSNAAVIASKEAIQDNGLELIAEEICPDNRTRFFALSKYPTKPTGDDKTFISFHPHVIDEAGVLHSCLTPLKIYKINMGAILERPDKNPIQRGYHFFVELNGHQQDFLVKRALEDINIYLDPENKYPDVLRIYGSYPNSHWNDSKK